MPSATAKASIKERVIAAVRKMAVMPAAAPAKQKASPVPQLMQGNALVWDVLMAMQDQIEAVGGFGFAVVGFRLEALQFLFRVMVPRERWRETFEKFQILKPYALHSMRAAAGGRDGGKGPNNQAAGSGRR